MKSRRPKNYEFKVALSFADEDRSYVEKVARTLRRMGIKVFYDKYSEVTFWGKDLYSYLDDVYRNKAEYTIIFISENYARKMWTNHERRSAQARAIKENKEYLLPVRFDDTEISGILPTTGTLNLKNISPRKLSEIIKDKIGPIDRFEFFPEEPDRLFSILKIRSDKEKFKAEVLARDFFEALKLMTPKERKALAHLIFNSCSLRVKNLHIDMQHLESITKLSRKELISIFARLNFLHIHTKISKRKHDHTDGKIFEDYSETLELTFDPLIDIKYGNENLLFSNGTYVLEGILKAISKNYCVDCRIMAFQNVDFSSLSVFSSSPNN